MSTESAESGEGQPKQQTQKGEQSVPPASENSSVVVETLKPCPFCGGAAKLTVAASSCDSGAWYWVNCKSSRFKCEVTPSTHHVFNQQQAINAWNARAVAMQGEKLTPARESHNSPADLDSKGAEGREPQNSPATVSPAEDAAFEKWYATQSFAEMDIAHLAWQASASQGAARIAELELIVKQKDDASVDSGERIEELLEERDRLRDMLQLVLPMAKGYAAEHPVGNNVVFCMEAEDALRVHHGDENGAPARELSVEEGKRAVADHISKQNHSAAPARET